MGLRYNDHREITAKFDSVGTCGHAVKKGDRIGYAKPRYGAVSVQCTACWRKWADENREADMYERAYEPEYGY